MARTRREVLGIAATSMVLAGCTGNGDTDGQDATTTMPETTSSQQTTTQSTSTTVTHSHDESTETAVNTEEPTSQETTVEGDAATVTMVNTSFSPHELEVPTGTTVVWTNQDGHGHTIVDAQFHDSAESWSYDSGSVASGGQASYTFESAGIYEYYCDVHGQGTMCGVVLVGGTSLDQDLPCEGGGGIY